MPKKNNIALLVFCLVVGLTTALSAVAVLAQEADPPEPLFVNHGWHPAADGEGLVFVEGDRYTFGVARLHRVEITATGEITNPVRVLSDKIIIESPADYNVYYVTLRNNVVVDELVGWSQWEAQVGWQAQYKIGADATSAITATWALTQTGTQIVDATQGDGEYAILYGVMDELLGVYPVEYRVRIISEDGGFLRDLWVSEPAETAWLRPEKIQYNPNSGEYWITTSEDADPDFGYQLRVSRYDADWHLVDDSLVVQLGGWPHSISDFEPTESGMGLLYSFNGNPRVQFFNNEGELIDDPVPLEGVYAKDLDLAKWGEYYIATFQDLNDWKVKAVVMDNTGVITTSCVGYANNPAIGILSDELAFVAYEVNVEDPDDPDNWRGIDQIYVQALRASDIPEPEPTPTPTATDTPTPTLTPSPTPTETPEPSPTPTVEFKLYLPIALKNYP